MQTNQAPQHSQPRSGMASAVLASLLVAAMQSKTNDTQQPVSARVPCAASQTPAPPTVKNIVKHKSETHRQYALQQATHSGESVLT